ncbi:MAG TPA: type II toxin-antitoxin system VapC family toxin [Saprospiraceae bacterium]|nr:type II toxin-antitoxin system VapC family toxin [Saprospiraceae bacterium]
MLLDSNIIIIASKLQNVRLLEKLKTYERSVSVSVITQIEVLGYHQLKAVEKLFLERFFQTIEVVPLSDSIVKKAIELRQQRLMSLADAVIAATSIVHQHPLLTENAKDYFRIADIELISVERFLSE